MLQGVLHRGNHRGSTPYYYDLEILAEKARSVVSISFAAAAASIASVTKQYNLQPCRNRKSNLRLRKRFTAWVGGP